MTKHSEKTVRKKPEKTRHSKAYIKPKLVCYGDVRDITLGGSPGGGDSGSPTVERRRN